MHFRGVYCTVDQCASVTISVFYRQVKSTGAAGNVKESACSVVRTADDLRRRSCTTIIAVNSHWSLHGQRASGWFDWLTLYGARLQCNAAALIKSCRHPSQVITYAMNAIIAKNKHRFCPCILETGHSLVRRVTSPSGQVSFQGRSYLRATTWPRYAI